MVSFKSLGLWTLSVAAVTAIPQYHHARFHHRALDTSVDVPQPVDTDNNAHTHQYNDTETGPIVAELKRDVNEPCASTHIEYVTSTNIATVTAPVRRWGGGSRTWNGNPWTQGQNTPAPAATSNAGIGVSVGVSMGAGASATTSAGSAAATGVTGGSSSGGKKGLAYNSNTLLTQFSSAGASWTYNWGSGSGGNVPSGMEFVPMLWGSKDVGAWAGAVKTAQANGAKHALSFNEPDFPQQANIDPATAAKLHIANMAPLSGSLSIGSPAISNSNIAGQGLDWMKSFLSACGGASNNCKIDFLAFHWYNNPGTFGDFQSHVSSVISLAKQNGINKVWLTEFAVNGGTDDQAAFLKQALPYLDSTPEVERYAYFMVGDGQMLTGGALNAAGKAYVSN